ncbi:cytochrome P450 [Umezawaea sp. Da 62-37]|uniref:cytochrome P450 n=1 Tax=Umezawaea sp. Da 62-37 TaxID=3075927 RepID=UPI0028F7150A|nr:cytochrome P450 [Umezawaea sp. Da 62-37]WNV86036.1 cytochrome P450 [Umezawaea sp. Da 62-37]
MTEAVTLGVAARAVGDLPGPRGLPLLGNLPGFVRGGVPHRTLEAWCDRYGSTFRMSLGRMPAVVTADPSVVARIQRQRPDEFRRSSHMTGVLDEIGVHGVFTAEGDEWRRLRKMATQALNAAYLRQYFSTIATVTERLKRRWDTSAGDGRSVDVLDDMMRYTLDVTSGLAMGHDLNSLEQTGDGLHRRLPLLFPEFGRRINAPVAYWRWFRLPRDRRLDATVREIDALVRDRFAEATRRMAGGGEPANFLEALVAPLEGESPFTHEEVFGNVLTMLLAGEDTTSSTAAWAIHHLAENPDVQERVRAEADEVLGDSGFPADPATVGRLGFAEAVVHEVARLRPVAPFLAFQPLRDVTFDTEHGPLLVEKGVPVFALMAYGARRDLDRYPEPEVFRPERWLEGRLPRESLPFMPFGGGPRFCPGRNLALLEATIVVSLLCRSFTVEPDTSAGVVEERMSFTAYPTNLRVRLRARQ